MACTRPLSAFYGPVVEPGKVNVVWKAKDSLRGKRLDLPCGKCPGCRLERSRQWAVRCVHEASLYDENCFITLTYDEAHLPKGCLKCGGKIGSLCLCDFQKFMKRLRKEFGPVRFFHCGEYGERFSRPHFHALLFGFNFPDRLLHSEQGGNRRYTSAALSRLWPYGFSMIGDVTYASAAYVARYVVKKNLDDDSEVWYDGRKPEYITMSRRPGIGAGWFEKYRADVFPSDSVVVDGKEFRPPRFYDDMLDKQDEEMLRSVKMKREQEALKVDPAERSAGRLKAREDVVVSRLSLLSRPLEGV